MSRSQYGTAGAASASSGTARTPDTQTIELRIGEFVTAWNRHDPAQMAAAWHVDGDLINPFGRVAKGRDQVRDLFRDEHSGPMKNCNHKMDISSIRLASADTAVVDAECTLAGARGPDGKEMPVFKPHVIMVMARKDGDWRILSARAYSYAPSPSAG